VIIDLEKFIAQEKPYWNELAAMIKRIDAEPTWKLDLTGAQRLHYLYERAAAAMARIQTYSSDPDMLRYLENLVAGAYGVIHSLGRPRRQFRPIRWFFGTFPRAFRKHIRAFALAVAVTLVGCAFGAAAVAYDPDAKGVIMPFGHGEMDPSERVKKEEQQAKSADTGQHSAFASLLMTHNIRVSMLTLALGVTFGVGTIVVLFYNGVILGAICFDYIRAGEGEFLAGWLLPHGSVEIPAILLAGQAGLILAAALIGRGKRLPMKLRLREVLGDLVTIFFGVAILLVWAGLVESFFSQYHEPTIPYWLKISFGAVQLILLTAFLAFSGRRGQGREAGEL
jgi:uncharacterized membrane protein SpoIIM required for sporulation